MTEHVLATRAAPASTRTGRDPGAPAARTQVRDALRERRGEPLSELQRERMESRLGVDLRTVRIRTDAEAARTAAVIGARALASGDVIALAPGESTADESLLTHELVHLRQQAEGRTAPLSGLGGDPGVRGGLEAEASAGRSAAPAARPPAPMATRGDVVQAQMAQPAQQRYTSSSTAHRAVARESAADRRVSTQGVNLERAERQNRTLAVRLGWAARLADVRPDWAALWDAGELDAFADAVAAWQRTTHIRPADGILGRNTWARIRPIGEVIAEREVDLAESKKLCYMATRERLTEGYAQATGERLGTGASADMFKWILGSRVDKMADIPQEYRATGAAGALVYAGRGTFVTEADIWDQKALRPGAALQVWWSRADYDSLVAATAKGGEFGTSAVFVRYEGDDAMVVLHYDRPVTWRRDSYEVFIAANVNARSEPAAE
jgi:hypothetical protein